MANGAQPTGHIPLMTCKKGQNGKRCVQMFNKTGATQIRIPASGRGGDYAVYRSLSSFASNAPASMDFHYLSITLYYPIHCLALDKDSKREGSEGRNRGSGSRGSPVVQHGSGAHRMYRTCVECTCIEYGGTCRV